MCKGCPPSQEQALRAVRDRYGQAVRTLLAEAVGRLEDVSLPSLGAGVVVERLGSHVPSVVDSLTATAHDALRGLDDYEALVCGMKDRPLEEIRATLVRPVKP